MKIRLIWKIASDSEQDQRAITLAGIIGSETKLALLPGDAGHGMKAWEALTLEVSGLTQELPEEGSANFRFTPQVCSKLHTIKQTLEKHGINAEVTVDGWSLLQYATQQERLAQRREKGMLEAVEMLKATRRWFKDHRLADIRRIIELHITPRD